MPPADLAAQIAELQAALISRCDELGARVASTVCREVEYYGDAGPVSHDELVASCKAHLYYTFQGLDARTAFDTAVAVSTGTSRAQIGTPLPALMEAYRIGCRLAWEEIVDLAAARPHIGRAALIRATARIWMAQDAFTHSMASAYREVITRKMLTQAAEQAALVEALIEGRVVQRASLWEIATVLGLPTRGPYVVVAAECPSIGKTALPGIEAKLRSLDIMSAWRLLPDVELGLVHVPGDTQFNSVKQTLARLAATRVGISVRFDDLGMTPKAVMYARCALSTERGEGSLVGVFEAKPLAIAAICAPQVMKEIATTILAGFADLDEQDREILFTTFRTWVSAGGAINAAAEQLYCHPNTIRHRLHRIEERTGRSTAHPRELAELCLAFEIDLQLP
ncbi:PucR family transcriptional regulator [Mycobacterium riyadhense]|uniref:PucR family transcriptional regulator n=1 Tax=Mycobacterium riyadhense TaxID=486698 RepID=A0A1X2D6B1_9MYCO|nr:helix-turn-helix domain-containing protein [Mycobacterium riyadhense]MCV7145907.1 helix-turn-helix domain-containing protein [Mycobacterium riyadhense]ORW83219.1 hypothetical protein AWC22_15185 [Mycobacterium riyadhense]